MQRWLGTGGLAVPSGIKPIKTPHEDPISHPELTSCFSPSDIGIWEIGPGRASPLSTTTPKASSEKPKNRGFFW